MERPLACATCGAVIGEWIDEGVPRNQPPRLRTFGAASVRPAQRPGDPDVLRLDPQDGERGPGGEIDFSSHLSPDKLLTIECLDGHVNVIRRSDVGRAWEAMGGRG